MFVTDSLFSLEFTISKLTVTPGVVCRFPAVAFRFLDFPTISLHLLDEVQRDRLRTKLTIDKEYQIPDQIKDYQDKAGYYEFNSGKSCLYKISPDNLRSLLSQVPLYVIIADGFTLTPSLVGSAMLPLTEAMEEVYELLLKDGVSVPASSGIRSSLTVYNLMGHAIGQVIVGCRVTSLGMALLTHLPENSVASHEQYKAGVYMPTLDQPTDQQTRPRPITEDPNISAALLDVAHEATIKNFPIVHVDKQPPAQQPTGMTDTTEKETQTGKTRKHNKLMMLEDNTVDEGIELVVPDIYCPPPLYYNKLSRAQPTVRYRQSVDLSDSVSVSHASDETSAAAVTKPGRYDSEFGKPLPDCIATPAVEIQDVMKAEEKIQTQSQIISDTLRSMGGTVGTTGFSPETFPLLNALVTELLNIVARPQKLQRTVSKVTSTPLKSPRRSSVRRSQEASPILSPSPGARSLASRDAVSPDPSRRPSSPGSRPQSRQSTRRGPLTFGYTNTQKLRLSRTNPDLLRRIEEQEAQARLKKEQIKMEKLGVVRSDGTAENQRYPRPKTLRLKIPKGRKKDGPRSFRSYTSQQPLDISTEMGRLTTDLADVRRELAEQKAQRTPRIDAATEVRSELGITRIITPTMARVMSPKPSQLTPRRSMSALSNRTSRDADLSTLHEQSFQSDSKRSLEIHLPTPILDEGEGHLSNSQSTKASTAAGRQSENPVNDSPYHTARESGDNSRAKSSLDMGDDYSMTFSPVGGEESPSAVEAYRDSYGSDSFASDD